MGIPPNKKTVFGGLLCYAKNKSPSKPAFDLEGFLLPANSNFHLHISYQRWVDSLLKKSLSVQGGFLPKK